MDGPPECCRSSVTQCFPRQLSYRDVFTSSDDWENNFFSRKVSTSTDDAGCLSSGSLAEGKRKDRTALALSSLIVRLFDQLRFAVITECKGRLQQQIWLITDDMLGGSCTGWKVTVQRRAEDNWWCGKILGSSESSFKLNQDPILIFV